MKLHEGKDEFIEFKVRKETLNQGNAVIAVRDASKTILWSWHIYVTHYSWDGSADVSLTARTTGERHDLAPVNVGYCDRLPTPAIIPITNGDVRIPCCLVSTMVIFLWNFV